VPPRCRGRLAACRIRLTFQIACNPVAIIGCAEADSAISDVP
jgi:hypothetical protein